MFPSLEEPLPYCGLFEALFQQWQTSRYLLPRIQALELSWPVPGQASGWASSLIITHQASQAWRAI